MVGKAKLNPSWRRFGGSYSQASVWIIALMAFLLVVSILPLIAIELVQASPENSVVLESWSIWESTVAATEHTVDKPSGTVDGDLLVAAMGTDGVETLTPPNGWTAITENTKDAMTFYVWYKIASSEPDNYTFTVSASEACVLSILRFSGHDSSNPINVSGSAQSYTTAPICPDVTTTVDDTLVLRLFGADDDDVTEDSNYPDGLTGVFVRGSEETGGEASAGAAYTTQESAGATGEAAFSLTSSEQWVAVTIAIAPSEVGPQEYSRPVSQGFSISAIVEIEVEKFAQEYERPIEQGFSLAGLAPSGAEFGRVLEQGFSFGAVVAIVMEICKLLSQTFGLTGTVGVTSGLSRSLAQDFSLDGSVEAKRELSKSVAQDFSLTGEVEAVVERFAQEYERPIEQGFSLAESITDEKGIAINLSDAFSFLATATGPTSFVRGLGEELSFTATLGSRYEYGRGLSGDFSLGATIDIIIQRPAEEFERDVAQGFSLEGTIIGHEYGDVYITSPWCNGRVNPIIAVDPTFSAIYTVTDNNIPNSAMFIQIQVGTSWNDNDLWDNITGVTIENGQRSPNVTYAGSTLTVNSLYWWRCRLGDSYGNWTEWTPPQIFGYGESPFDLMATAMFIFPLVLMGMALAFDNPVFASFAGVVFILSGLYFIDTIWLSLIFIGIGVYLLITAFLSEEDWG